MPYPKVSLEDIFSGKAEYTSSNRLRHRLINEGIKEHKCEICGMTEWLGQPIPLELDHIDGNHLNNNLANLRIVCPNCHALTENYCGKNTEKHKQNIVEAEEKEFQKEKRKANDLDFYGRSFTERSRSPDRETLKEEIRNNSFLSIGKKYGVSDNAVREWCDHYGLPKRYWEIKNMSNEDWAEL